MSCPIICQVFTVPTLEQALGLGPWAWHWGDLPLCRFSSRLDGIVQKTFTSKTCCSWLGCEIYFPRQRDQKLSWWMSVYPALLAFFHLPSRKRSKHSASEHCRCSLEQWKGISLRAHKTTNDGVHRISRVSRRSKMKGICSSSSKISG